jgi:methionyl-tRNA formyltransferase
MLRLLFFGTPEFAVPSLETLLESAHRVVGAITQPDRPKGRGHQVVAPPVKELALRHGVPVWQPTRLKDEAWLDEMRRLEPDLGVVAAYGRILPDALLAIPRLGMINVHASLLPAWRGASPVHRAVMAGDARTGVSIMRLVRELDAGPVFATAARAIGDTETSADVERDLARIGAALLLPVIAQLEAGTATAAPQDDSCATFAPRLTKDEGRLDWTQPARAVHDRIRGLHPWPLASSWVNGTRLLLLRARPADAPGPGTVPEPGTVLVATGGRLVVACGHHTALELLEVQPEGRRPMAVRDFLAGHRITPGARFTATATESE